MLTKYLDKNNNGLIEEDEFTQKISYENYQQNAHKYKVSLQNFFEVFIVTMLGHIGNQRKKIEKMILQFDENGDNLIQFDEFHKLMEQIEPKMS